MPASQRRAELPVRLERGFRRSDQVTGAAGRRRRVSAINKRALKFKARGARLMRVRNETLGMRTSDRERCVSSSPPLVREVPEWGARGKGGPRHTLAGGSLRGSPAGPCGAGGLLESEGAPSVLHPYTSEAVL